jgi:hypothetical protein
MRAHKTRSTYQPASVRYKGAAWNTSPYDEVSKSFGGPQMSSYKIIHEAHASIGNLILRKIRETTDHNPTLVTSPPRFGALDELTDAFVSVYLRRVGPDEEGLGGNAGWGYVEQVDGQEVMRRGPTFTRLDFLISTWSKNEKTEHELLASVMQTIIDHPVLKGTQLEGESFQGDEELPLIMSSKLSDDVLARFWSSVNQPIRPAIECWTTVPLHPSKRMPVNKRVIDNEIRTGLKRNDNE